MIGLDEVSIPNMASGVDVLALDEALEELTSVMLASVESSS